MLHDWGVIVAALCYIGFLFCVASYGDRIALFQSGRAKAVIYPLSLAIYCTSWTFFGSVGVASRTSVDFLAIYVGPILFFAFFSPVLRRVIHLAKTQNITSIADFIAARYGKSQAVAATVAVIAIIGSVPYIALQLKAVGVVAGNDPRRGQGHCRRSHRRRHGAGRDAGDGDVRRAVRHEADQRDRASARLDAGGGYRIHRQAGGVHHRRRLRDILDVRAPRSWSSAR